MTCCIFKSSPLKANQAPLPHRCQGGICSPRSVARCPQPSPGACLAFAKCPGAPRTMTSGINNVKGCGWLSKPNPVTPSPPELREPPTRLDTQSQRPRIFQVCVLASQLVKATQFAHWFFSTKGVNTLTVALEQSWS